ncbi:conserved hypothetical protein [Xanthomonas citri pv. citri]|nr:conserved hypothetical protein [Xanthomonas citri pv. citri]CEJ21470.1 conserved hypothetical protein [Xanthomonas citri pv. citri]CEJ26060.1 conserved hypothetical protein [Xanthomonas citri pv. citri]
MSALSHVGNFRKFSLTSTQQQSNYYRVAAQSATGFDSPYRRRTSAHRSMHGAFFMPAVSSWVRASQFYGGRCAEAFGPAGDSYRSVNRAPSATPFDSVVADSNNLGARMSYDAQEAPANAARQIAHYFGLIADTLDWNHTAWLALQAKLQAMGKAPEALTLADVEAAISSINADLAEVRQ